jgi:hypothetical protein
MKVISKSRFKLGLECPNKLFYTGKEEYVNKKNNDPFLMALASGGFQIEEYARMHYPGGVLVDGDYRTTSYEDYVAQTNELLARESVIIYEAAFLVDHLFIRVDILVKEGNKIKLIEVKSKSHNPNAENVFVGVRGGINKDWKSYLFDVAFQKHVVELCMPNATVTPYLYLADKSKVASVDGLNQMFRVTERGDQRTGVEKREENFANMGDSVLVLVDVSQVVDDIMTDKHKYYDNLGFLEAIELFTESYKNDTHINWPTAFSKCKKCEFRASDDELAEGKLSGFNECIKKHHNWSEADFKKPNIFNVWDLKDPKLLENNLLFKDQLDQEDIKYKEVAGRLSRTERQWLQIEKERDEDFTEYVDVDGLRDEMKKWKFPLHFIDFETSTVALPFYAGRKPYEQIAFQFSHHIYHEDGRLEHAHEYINTTPGEFPNFKFIAKLKEALSSDDGTIFKFAPHENTIVNAIYQQLKSSNELNKEELMEFIINISHSTDDSPDEWEGDRDMVDLCNVIKRYYYNPYTFGSNSIKQILPSILKTSAVVRNKYSQSLREIGISSKNFPDSHVWLMEEDGEIVSPYKMLPEVFGMNQDDLEEKISGIVDINDGGAALTAYGKIQYTDMSAIERGQISDALLKYCELDTLAMVMIYEHLNSLVKPIN